MNNVTRAILSAYFQADMVAAQAQSTIDMANRQLEETNNVKADVLEHFQDSQELQDIAEVLTLSPTELILAAIAHFGIGDEHLAKLNQRYVHAVGGVGFSFIDSLVEKLRADEPLTNVQINQIAAGVTNMVDVIMAEKTRDQQTAGGNFGSNQRQFVSNVGQQFRFFGDDLDAVYRQRLSIISGVLSNSVSMQHNYGGQSIGGMMPAGLHTSYAPNFDSNQF